MNSTATITVDKRQLLNALKQLQKIEKVHKKTRQHFIEIRNFDGKRGI